MNKIYVPLVAVALALTTGCQKERTYERQDVDVVEITRGMFGIEWVKERREIDYNGIERVQKFEGNVVLEEVFERGNLVSILSYKRNNTPQDD